MLARTRARGRIAAVAVGIVVTVAGCGGGKSTPAPAAAPSSRTPSSQPSPGAPSLPPVVPGIPDPCALLSATQILSMANIEATAKSGPVDAAAGGRACAYNAGRPDAVTISLTPVSKAGFDAFRQLAPGTVTNLPGIGQEAYRSSQTPGVVDVLNNGFDLNVWVIHAEDITQANTDAKALALALAPKV